MDFGLEDRDKFDDNIEIKLFERLFLALLDFISFTTVHFGTWSSFGLFYEMLFVCFTHYC